MISYLALGSNLNHPRRQLVNALTHLNTLPRTVVLQVSELFFNPAVGRRSQPPFYNMVIKIDTKLDPQTLLRYCLAVERKQHRLRKIKWGARTLDIDILTFGNLTFSRPHLQIPHPRMQERDFVMRPLNQLQIIS